MKNEANTNRNGQTIATIINTYANDLPQRALWQRLGGSCLCPSWLQIFEDGWDLASQQHVDTLLHLISSSLKMVMRHFANRGSLRSLRNNLSGRW